MEVARSVYSYSPAEEIRIIPSIASPLAISVEGIDAIMFLFQDSFLDAVRVRADTALRNVEGLRVLMYGDFCLCTSGAEDGFWIELGYYDDQGRHIPNGLVELSAWGRLCP